MKSYFVVFILLAFNSINLLGQSVPGFFNYQLAVRNASGEILRNRSMSFEIYITENANEHDPKKFLFHERHDDKRTNNVGIASFQIGGGQKQNNSKDLSKIKFLNKELYINVAVDTNNGNQFSLLSTTQLISVPYAFVADTSKFALKADDLSQRGASPGQVLKWDNNSDSWKPADDDKGGTSSTPISTNLTLQGEGTISKPLGIAKQNAKQGEVLKWDDGSNSWKPASDIGGGNGDDWGGQSVLTDNTIKGNGTQSSILGLAQNGASNGQVLKWNGAAWLPANDELSGTSLIAGNGISINNNRIYNTGDTVALDDITTSTSASGDISGQFPNLNVTKLQGKQISTNTPYANQVLTWDSIGKFWTPKTLNGSFNNSWSLTGNSGTNTNINFIGTIDDKDIVFKRNGILSGLINNNNNNLAFGVAALNSNSNGEFNVAIGNYALRENTGFFNMAIGCYSLLHNITGEGNIGIGVQTLGNNELADFNIAIGNEALLRHTSGDLNIAIGHEVMGEENDGDNNIAIGKQIFYQAKNCNGNVIIGNNSMRNCVNGGENTVLGDHALYNNLSGNFNSAIGSQSLLGIDSCSEVTSIGWGTGSSIPDISNSSAIGAKAVVMKSNQVQIGGTGTTKIGGLVNWSLPSDGRFKENIQRNIPGLDFIKILQPVSYTMNNEKLIRHVTSKMPDSLAKNYLPNQEQIKYDQQKIKSGFIAQEVEQAAIKIGYDFDGVNSPANETDTYSIAYSQFVPSIVKAIQEQQVLIESQEKTITELKKELVNMNQLELFIQKMQKEMTELKEKINK